MDKDTFLAKHGPIRLLDEVDAHFARLRQPHFENGKWQTHDRQGPKILDGHFYSIGYFRHDVDPRGMEHDWEALDAALGLAHELAGLLRAGGCRTLNSEGDAPYFPFVCSTGVSNRRPDFEAMGAVLPEALRAAYDSEEIRATYDPFIDGWPLSGRECVFWSDELGSTYAEDMSPESLAAFRRVSDRMLSDLEVPWRISFYPDFVEFPVIYGGIDIHGSFVGVITSCVWT